MNETNTRTAQGFIYFAFAPAIELVKIGWSVLPLQRLGGVMAEVRTDLELLGALPGTRVEERAEHIRFAHLWYGGEWFFQEESILNYARSLPVVTPLDNIPYRGVQLCRYPEFQSARRKWAPARACHWPERVRDLRFGRQSRNREFGEEESA